MTNEYTDYYDGSGNTKSTYDKNRKGFDITLGRQQGEYIQNYITLKNRKDTHMSYVSGPENYSDAAHQQYLKDNFGLTRSIILTRVFDSRDNVFAPTEGSRYSLSTEFAGKGLGGDFSFNKYTAEARKYYKTGPDHVIATRLMAGYASGSIADSSRFAVGGPDTLRGYKEDEFKGNKMFAATAEYRFPIVSKVQGVVFSDVGNAWTDGGYSLKGLKASGGIGIRVTTPIGPIRVDFAKGKEGGRTHFSFGGQF
jgi:outer membrane protein insertion porin family